MPLQRFGRRIGAILGLILLAVAAASCSAPEKAPVARVAPVDFVLVEKGARTLQLVRGGTAVRTYRIALGRDPVGAKRREGDGRTPEGRYYVDGRNPDSRFHLALHISYPSPDDFAAAEALGLAPGSDIMIHGLPNGISAAEAARHPSVDWTDGCIAVTNEEIEEIWRLVADGTLAVIRP